MALGLLTAVERHVVATLSTAAGGVVRQVGAISAQLDEATIKRVLTQAPGLYVSFLGAVRQGSARLLAAKIGVYAISKNAAGKEAQRQGNASAIGAYDLVELVCAALDRHIVPQVGELRLDEISNLFSEAFAQLGCTVYGITFELPLALPAEVDTSDLADFETFHGNWDIPVHGNVAPPLPADGAADATDHVIVQELP